MSASTVSHQRRGRFGLAGVLAFALAAVVLLHRLGDVPAFRLPRSGFGDWLVVAPPADALMGLLRVVALACAYWLLASTAAYALARLSRIPGAARAVGWAALPSVRRLADRAVALTLATSAVVGPAAPALAEHLSGVGRAPVLVQAEAEVVVPPGAPQPPERPGRDPGAAGARRRVVVAPGDSLWRIAAREVTRVPGAREVAPLWRAIIEANRHTLRSGDPDLIHPGERVLVPGRPAPSAGADEPSGADAVGPLSSPASEHEGAVDARTYALPVPRELLAADPALMDRPHHTYPAWDVAVATGTPVFAAAAGTVIGVPAGGSCGNGVVVAGTDGYHYVYCHGSAVTTTVGAQVQPGELIMRSGNTGRSTGPHLHFEIRTPARERVCPQPLLRAWFEDEVTGPDEATEDGCVSRS